MLPPPANPNVTETAALADELVRLKLVDVGRMNELLAEFSSGSPSTLLEFLIARRILTHFQAEMVISGKGRFLSLGPYRVIDRGGFGTFGEVFLATRRDRPGSVYRLSLFPLRSLWRARQIKQLVRSLSDSPHRGVVSPADIDSANGYHYIVWPHTAGQSLVERVTSGGPLPCGQVAGLLAHLAEALLACHGRNISHGALSPHVVQLTSDGLPRLLELGAGAVLASELGSAERMLDTLSCAFALHEVLEYAAPEFAVDPTPQPLADQFALGAIGYFAVTGRPPFPGCHLSERLAARASDHAPPLNRVDPAIPAGFSAVIARMLAPGPADRFADLDEARHLLVNLATSAPEEPTEEAVPAPPVPLWKACDPIRPELPAASPTQLPPEFPPVVTGSGVLASATRDDSDASVNFDLPEEEQEPRIDPLPTPLPLAVVPAETPKLPDHAAQPARPVASSEVRIGATRGKPDPGPGQHRDLVPSDPRKEVRSPIQYHTESGTAGEQLAEELPEPPPPSVFWKKLKRNILFWRPPTQALQVSVFGPAHVVPGQSTILSVYVHTTDSQETVRTLSRVFHQDAELLGTGLLAEEVPLQAELAVHLGIANAGVSQSLLRMTWRGQPHRSVFELHVPWEAPGGPSPGLVSVGRNNVRIGKIEFFLPILPRTG